MGRQRQRRAPRTRSTGYRFEGSFDESIVERILDQGRSQGIVTEFDTGRGKVVWFNGKPGKELRAIRERIRSLINEPQPYQLEASHQGRGKLR